MPFSCSRRYVVSLVVSIMREQCPDDARILVRKGYRRYVLMTSTNELYEPTLPLIIFALGNADHRTGAVDQQCSQVGISTLANAKQQRLATTGMLPGYQP